MYLSPLPLVLGAQLQYGTKKCGPGFVNGRLTSHVLRILIISIACDFTGSHVACLRQHRTTAFRLRWQRYAVPQYKVWGLGLFLGCSNVGVNEHIQNDSA